MSRALRKGIDPSRPAPAATKSGGFLAAAQVERILAFTPPEARDVALELRSIVAAVCPHATETVLWGALSYHDATKGGRVKGAICGVELGPRQAKLSFIHGVRLADPHRLLKGTRLSKRHVLIPSYDEAPWEAIRDLVKQAAELDPRSFGPISDPGTLRGRRRRPSPLGPDERP